jgi:hypothetical protein
MRADGILAADIRTRWAARQRRQQNLGKPDYTAYIGEAALHIPYGGTAALHAQLAHLLAHHDCGTPIRIIPRRQTRVLLHHPWLWMNFASSSPVVHVELMPASFFIHDNEVQPYTRARERLDKTALSPAESRTLISEAMQIME